MNYLECLLIIYMETKEIYTKDLGEGSAFYTSGLKFLRLENGNNFFWFVFEDIDAKKISTSYWSGELAVKAKAYYEAMRTLKTLIYSRN